MLLVGERIRWFSIASATSTFEIFSSVEPNRSLLLERPSRKTPRHRLPPAVYHFLPSAESLVVCPCQMLASRHPILVPITSYANVSSASLAWSLPLWWP